MYFCSVTSLQKCETRTQIRFSFPRFFRSTGASGKCFEQPASQAPIDQARGDGACQDEELPLPGQGDLALAALDARIVARATVSGDICGGD